MTRIQRRFDRWGVARALGASLVAAPMCEQERSMSEVRLTTAPCTCHPCPLVRSRARRVQCALATGMTEESA